MTEIATHEQVERALLVQRRQSDAQKMLSRLMRLKELSEDYDSPVIKHLRAELEKLAEGYGRDVLNKKGEEAEEAKKYFHVIHTAWDIIESVVREWHKLNKQIIDQSRR